MDDEETEGLRRFNEMVHEDADLHGLMLPIADGLLAAVLRSS